MYFVNSSNINQGQTERKSIHEYKCTHNPAGPENNLFRLETAKSDAVQDSWRPVKTMMKSRHYCKSDSHRAEVRMDAHTRV